MKRPSHDVITFDCYGTLVDWQGGISQAFVNAARADGVRLDAEAVFAAYVAVEPACQATQYESYREILARTALLVAPRLGWALAPERAGFLAESLPSWPAFPDTNAALRRLKDAGHRLGILSNIDTDLLAATRREQLSVDFDFAITAEDVRSYKPAHPHFAEARRRLGEGARWLHAAQSYFHDVEPAVELGIPVAWINRNRERRPGTAVPTTEVGDLAQLADWVAD